MKVLGLAISFGMVLSILNFTGATAQDDAEPSFGQPGDIAFATELWRELEAARLVGPRSIIAQPYEGSDPHGVILITLDSTVTMEGREDTVIVKKNYAGEDISIESVATKPDQFLDAITVMFRREQSGRNSPPTER